MSSIKATWNIELNCDCPFCEQHVDLLDYPDFWDGRSIELGENGTDRAANVEVICPKCRRELVVDLQY